MSGMPMLDVLIGLIFVYLFLALVCTSINEMIAGWFDSREKHLRAGISNLLGEHAGAAKQRRSVPFHDPVTGDKTEDTMVKSFYAHPLIKSLHEDGTLPSYIPAATFSQVLLDLFAPSDGKTPKSIPAFINGVENALSDNPDLKKTLLVLSDDVLDTAQLRAALETWFNNSMERVSAWYKNKSQKAVIFISIAVCFAINADSIELAKDLYQNPAKRSAIVAQAEQSVKAAASSTSAAAVTDAQRSKTDNDKLIVTLQHLNNAGFSWGWSKEHYFENFVETVLKVIGILLTALAASLGAPFWFDMLNKLINIRSVGKPPADQPASTPSVAPKQVAVNGGVESVG